MDRPLLRAAGRAAGWALASAMIGVGLTRLIRSESRPRLIGLQGIGGWLLLPAHPLVIAAAAARKPALTAVAASLPWAMPSYSGTCIGPARRDQHRRERCPCAW